MLSNGTGINMGFVVGPPVATTNNTLLMRYKGGDVCNVKSTTVLYRSTTILFHCSLRQVDINIFTQQHVCSFFYEFKIHNVNAVLQLSYQSITRCIILYYIVSLL